MKRLEIWRTVIWNSWNFLCWIWRKTETVLNYDYVDSSYVQNVIYLRFDSSCYVGMPIHGSVLDFLYRRKNYLLLTCLALVTVNCMFEAFWVRPSQYLYVPSLCYHPSVEFKEEKSEMREFVRVLKNYLYNLSYQLLVIVLPGDYNSLYYSGFLLG